VLLALRLEDHGPPCLQSDLSPIPISLRPLRSKEFASDAHVKQSAISLQMLDTHFFYARIQALVAQWDKCSSASVESGVYHLLRICRVYAAARMKFSASECSLSYFVSPLFSFLQLPLCSGVNTGTYGFVELRVSDVPNLFSAITT
jgi:hypothetical protein